MLPQRQCVPQRVLRSDAAVLQRHDLLRVVAAVRLSVLPNRPSVCGQDDVLPIAAGVWQHLLVSVTGRASRPHPS